MWYPARAQTGLFVGKLVEQVKADPSLAAEDPYKGIVTQDPVFLRALAGHGSFDTTLGYFDAEARTANPAEDLIDYGEERGAE
jgi:hypothetical protein